MTELSRFKGVGAVLAESFDDANCLCSLKSRGWSVVGNPQFSDGGLSFDGVGDYVVLGSYDELRVKGHSFSFHIKLKKLSSFGNLEGIIGGTDKKAFGIRFSTSTNSLVCFVRDTTNYLDTGYDLTIGEDTNITWVFDKSSGQKFYVNGVLVASNTNTIVYGSNGSVQLGRDYVDNSRCSNINVSKLLVFPRALSSQEVLDLHDGTTFDYDKYLVASYDMSTVNPRDTSGHGNDAVGVGIGSSNIVDGVNSLSKAISFNGVDEYLTIINNDDINFTTEMSMVACFNPITITSTAAHPHAIISKNGYIQYQMVYYAPNDFECRFGNRSLIQNGLEIGTFNIVGASYKNGSQLVSLNGDLVNIGSSLMVDNSSSEPIYIGYGTLGRVNANAIIDNILFYNKYLTTIQHADISNRIRNGGL